LFCIFPRTLLAFTAWLILFLSARPMIWSLRWFISFSSLLSRHTSANTWRWFLSWTLQLLFSHLCFLFLLRGISLLRGRGVLYFARLLFLCGSRSLTPASVWWGRVAFAALVPSQGRGFLNWRSKLVSIFRCALCSLGWASRHCCSLLLIVHEV
jgi:hypothetical protein